MYNISKILTFALGVECEFDYKTDVNVHYYIKDHVGKFHVNLYQLSSIAKEKAFENGHAITTVKCKDFWNAYLDLEFVLDFSKLDIKGRVTKFKGYVSGKTEYEAVFKLIDSYFIRN